MMRNTGPLYVTAVIEGQGKRQAQLFRNSNRQTVTPAKGLSTFFPAKG